MNDHLHLWEYLVFPYLPLEDRIRTSATCHPLRQMFRDDCSLQLTSEGREVSLCPWEIVTGPEGIQPTWTTHLIFPSPDPSETLRFILKIGKRVYPNLTLRNILWINDPQQLTRVLTTLYHQIHCLVVVIDLPQEYLCGDIESFCKIRMKMRSLLHVVCIILVNESIVPGSPRMEWSWFSTYPQLRFNVSCTWLLQFPSQEEYLWGDAMLRRLPTLKLAWIFRQEGMAIGYSKFHNFQLVRYPLSR